MIGFISETIEEQPILAWPSTVLCVGSVRASVPLTSDLCRLPGSSYLHLQGQIFRSRRNRHGSPELLQPRAERQLGGQRGKDRTAEHGIGVLECVLSAS